MDEQRSIPRRYALPILVKETKRSGISRYQLMTDNGAFWFLLLLHSILLWVGWLCWWSSGREKQQWRSGSQEIWATYKNKSEKTLQMFLCYLKFAAENCWGLLVGVVLVFPEGVGEGHQQKKLRTMAVVAAGKQTDRLNEAGRSCDTAELLGLPP